MALDLTKKRNQNHAINNSKLIILVHKCITGMQEMALDLTIMMYVKPNCYNNTMLVYYYKTRDDSVRQFPNY